MNRQTTLAKNNNVAQNWLQVDATDQVLGRLASKLAQVLMGKNKPQYTPHHDVGDFVIVTNVDKLRLTGNKAEQKHFQTYSGYPGGQKRFSYTWMLKNKPELLLERAVRRMMPRGPLTHARITKLKMYRSGEQHEHQAQQPKAVKL